MKRLMKRIVVLIMICAILMNTTKLTVLATEIDENEQILFGQTVSNGDVETEQLKSESVQEMGASDYVYETENYRIVSSLSGCWDGGHNIIIDIENLSDIPLTDWYICFDTDAEITNIWNAEIVYVEGRSCLIRNVGWNADIPVNGSVQFGITFGANFDRFPEVYTVLSGDKMEAGENCDVIYTIEHSWESGFVGMIMIQNISDHEVIEDWVIEFDYENEIESLWNGEIIVHEGNHYAISHLGYNREIEVDGSVSIGFLVNDGNVEADITNISVSSHSVIDQAATDSEIEDETDCIVSRVKAADEGDIVYNENTGVSYVKNQILICTHMGVPEDVIEMLATDIHAEVVGYLDGSLIYQLEFEGEKDYDELADVIQYLEGFSFLSCVSLNYVSYLEDQYEPNDKLYRDKRTYEWNGEDGIINNPFHPDYWDTANPDGDNWGLEALRVPEAWNYREQFKGAVKVGIYDNEFDVGHPDLKFEKVYYNNRCGSNHGTHVAGIIGAEFDNNEGVAGVATDIELYASSRVAADTLAEQIERYENLIRQGARVINMSIGYEEERVFAASHHNQNVIEAIAKEADVVAHGLQNLILEGYDFILIQAAGNGNNDFYIKNNSEYGYIKGKSTDYEAYHGGTDAKYANYFTAIPEDQLAYSRIVVVGSVDHNVSEDGITAYSVSDFSNRGSRVDIYAPGRNILSTAHRKYVEEGYILDSGTSMAAPYITGLAALIWQANPSLTALQVKNIILNNPGHAVMDESDECIGYMPDAEACVKTALAAPGGARLYEEVMAQGTLKGKVTDNSGNPIKNAEIILIRTSIGQSNLENYCFTKTTDDNGNYEISIPMGTYEMLIVDTEYLHLPYQVKGIKVIPDEIKYMQTAIMVRSYASGLTQSVKIHGVIKDAITGQALPNTRVRARSGWDNLDGAYVYGRDGKENQTVSDANGEFILPLTPGNYTVEMERAGYIRGTYNMISYIDENGEIQSAVLTPVLSEDEYRIVLTWGKKPRDLDAHLTYDQDGQQKFHVYYSSTKGKVDGSIVATLDQDNIQSYGPETITAKITDEMLQSGVFRYSVYKYSSDGTWSDSGAVVRLYSGNNLLDTFFMPNNSTNDLVWRVFYIDQKGIHRSDYFYNTYSSNIR